jgi:MFS family permease
MTGFTTDIGAASADLNLAVSLFFITFVIFQPISSAVGRRVGAKNWIPFIMVSLLSSGVESPKTDMHDS